MGRALPERSLIPVVSKAEYVVDLDKSEPFAGVKVTVDPLVAMVPITGTLL